MAKHLVALALLAVVAISLAEPPAEYGAPSYGAPNEGGYGGGSSYNEGGYEGGDEYGGGGGWGSGFSKLALFKPKFRYINLRIPIPVFPRIRFNVGAKVKAQASVQQAQGW